MEIKAFDKEKRTNYLLVGKVCTLQDYDEIHNLIRNNVKLTNKIIIIDLARITFISSQGLGSLISLFNSLKNSDIQLVLYNPRGEIKQELEMSGITMVIPTVYSDEELEKMIAMKNKRK